MTKIEYQKQALTMITDLAVNKVLAKYTNTIEKSHLMFELESIRQQIKKQSIDLYNDLIDGIKENMGWYTQLLEWQVEQINNKIMGE